MTLMSRLLYVYPASVVTLWGACALWLWLWPGPLPVLALLFFVYGWPLLCYRVHARLYPLKQGASHLASDEYSPWWGGHQIQLVYIAFPTIEMVLKMFPGLYSFWLRCWGSKVGRNVYWTPQTEVVDRALVDIGDDVVIGHRVGIYPHLIKPTKKNVLLYAKTVTIGSGAFIGANTALLPGVVVAPGAVVEMGTRTLPRERVE